MKRWIDRTHVYTNRQALWFAGGWLAGSFAWGFIKGALHL